MESVPPTTPSRPQLPSGSSPQTAIDLTEEHDTVASIKRKRVNEPVYPSVPAKSSKAAIAKGKAGQASHSGIPPSPQKAVLPQYEDEPTPKKAKKGKVPPQEKRARRFRPQAPQNFGDTYLRATTQRFYVLQRKRMGNDECPEEEIELTGSTGSIYHVTIEKVPNCTCPQAKKGLQCKHIVFVMSKVLRAPYDYVYQLALLSSELQEIFAAAPSIDEPAAAEAGASEKRKPIEGDCPICYSELEPGDVEQIVWCRAACGQNMHQGCFQTWARSKASGKVTCPMCRSEWEGDEKLLSQIDRSKGTMVEGYINVADQLGISTVRDTSTYSRWYEIHRRRRERAQRRYDYDYDPEEELWDEL